MPIAVLDGATVASPTLSYVHTDHLMRPVLMSLSRVAVALNSSYGSSVSFKAIVWQAVWRPDGTAQSIIGNPTQNLRYPGQYFLVEQGLHYNWHRFYDPTTGRYTQPDPLGFIDGPAIYAYAGNNPVMFVDPWGLDVAVAIGGETPGNPFGHAALGFTGRGPYSYGTGTKLGSSFTDYLSVQSKYRNTTIYIIPTTPEQDQRMIDFLQRYEGVPLPNPWSDFWAALNDTCSTRSQRAFESAGINSWLAPFISPFPMDLRVLAARKSTKYYRLNQGAPVPSGFSEFNNFKSEQQ